MRKILKLLKFIFIFLILFIITFGSYITYKGYNLYKTTLAEASIETKISEIQNNPKYVKKNELPEEFINAVIDIEDNRFYSHSAIDLISIGRAFIVNLTNFSFLEGGSTITQQVSKNVFLTQRREATRKIAEIFYSYDLEKKYDKDTIFEIYVNTNYFGDGYYGIKEAANGYFDKEPSEMTPYESTLLAGVPNAPSVYAPTVNPDLAAKRQKIVINAMNKYGHMSDEQKDELFKEIDEKNQ